MEYNQCFTVFHKRFGKGKVIRRIVDSGEEFYDVRFDNGEEHTFGQNCFNQYLYTNRMFNYDLEMKTALYKLLNLYEEPQECKKCWNEIVYEYMKSKQVYYLLHFTNIENIESIIKYGIQSRDKLNKNNIRYYYNDISENENKSTYISTSIEFPNYKMRYSCEENKGTVFAIIQVKLDIILKKDFLLYDDNANKYGIKPLKDYKKLFTDIGRSSLIRKNNTTNPQAEVRIHEDISTDYFNYIFVKDEYMKEKVKKIVCQYGFSQDRIRIRDEYFSYRQDFRSW